MERLFILDIQQDVLLKNIKDINCHYTRFDEKKDDLVTDFYVSKEDKKPLYEAPEYNDEKQDFDVDWSKFNKYEVIIDTSDDNLRIQEFKYVEAK